MAMSSGIEGQKGLENEEHKRLSDTKKENRKRKLDKREGEEEREPRNGNQMAKWVVMPPKNLAVAVRDGIRYLQPYWGTYCGFAKNRWIGRTVADVFASEFTAIHPLYAKAAVRKGRLFLNKRPLLSADYKIRESDHFIHINHRHETEVPDLPIEILADTDDVLVVNKPAGLPVHPCGNYNVHTVVGLLRRDYGHAADEPMRPLFRLDRTTTGLLMFAKNEKFDAKFKRLIANRELQKEYVCKVLGQFPEGEVTCDARIGILSHHMGIRCVKSDGQHAFSSFRLLHFCPEENTSVLSCRIETGRTHQIRIHLQYLGYPVVGDNLYNDEAWGPNKGKGADYGQMSMEQLRSAISNRHSKKHWIVEQDPDYEERLQKIGDDESIEQEKHNLDKLGEELESMPEWDPICWDCSIRKKLNMHEKGTPMLPLHCWRYSGDGWSYEAPLPEWAKFRGGKVAETGETQLEEHKQIRVEAAGS